MKHQILMFVGAWLTALAVQSHAQESITTTWKGTLDARGTELRLEIDITRDAQGTVTGQLRSLNQNNATLKLQELDIDGDVLHFEIPEIGASFHGQYEQNGNTASGVFTQNGVELPLQLTQSDSAKTQDSAEAASAEEERLKEAWIGKLDMGAIKPVMQFRVVESDAGESTAYFDSITEGRTGFKATWSIDGDELKFDVPQIKLTYRGILNETRDAAEGTWSQGGRALPLKLEKSDSEFDNVNVWENRPQRPKEPFPYDAEEVKFENSTDQLTLAGTLTIPGKPGRHPAVVLISGSGPQDRDESLMEHKPFLVLADHLTRQGIAVLRYDDRGTAESTGEFSTATIEDFAKDAAAAVDFLKGHGRIDPHQIGLIGHSEGGLVAPMVVGMRDDIALVVLLAATGVDGMAIAISQSEAMLRAEGADEDTINRELAISKAALKVVVDAKGDSDISEELAEAMEGVIQSIPEPDRETAEKEIRGAMSMLENRLKSRWMRSFLTYDPRPALRQIDCPVLAIIGTKDVQVLPDLNMPEIERALSEGGNPDFETVRLPDLNHLFQRCETGSMSEYATISETFNPVALETISQWLLERTTTAE